MFELEVYNNNIECILLINDKKAIKKSKIIIREFCTKQISYNLKYKIKSNIKKS